MKRPFWKGFESKHAGAVPAKKHVIVLYWEDTSRGAADTLNRERIRFPTVKVKLVKVGNTKGNKVPGSVTKFPTMLLLKNGREVDRIEDNLGPTVVSQFLGRASS